MQKFDSTLQLLKIIWVESKSLARKRKGNKKKEIINMRGMQKVDTKVSVIAEFSSILVIYYKILWKKFELLSYFMEEESATL